MMDRALQEWRPTWWVLIIYGVVAILFGIFALVAPLGAAVSLVWALGIMALAEGVVSIFALFDRDGGASRGWLLLYAIASAVFGVLAVINPLMIASVLLIMLAVWLILAGIFRIVLAIRIRKEIRGEWLIALSGVCSLTLGVLFFLSPVLGVMVTTVWMGVLALFYGVLQILAGWRLRELA